MIIQRAVTQSPGYTKVVSFRGWRGPAKRGAQRRRTTRQTSQGPLGSSAQRVGGFHGACGPFQTAPWAGSRVRRTAVRAPLGSEDQERACRVMRSYKYRSCRAGGRARSCKQGIRLFVRHPGGLFTSFHALHLKAGCRGKVPNARWKQRSGEKPRWSGRLAGAWRSYQ